MLCGLANAAPVKANKVIQTSLSCGVAHLIASVHDPTAAIAQRAILAIRAMPSSSLKVGLSSQFFVTHITDFCTFKAAKIIER